MSTECQVEPHAISEKEAQHALETVLRFLEETRSEDILSDHERDLIKALRLRFKSQGSDGENEERMQHDLCVFSALPQR